MDRLSIYLTLMTGAVLTGALVVAAFSFGWYGWLPILGAAAIGFAAAWPVALMCKCRMKIPQKCRAKIPHFRVLGSAGIRHGGLRSLAGGPVFWGPAAG